MWSVNNLSSQWLLSSVSGVYNSVISDCEYPVPVLFIASDLSSVVCTLEWSVTTLRSKEWLLFSVVCIIEWSVTTLRCKQWLLHSVVCIIEWSVTTVRSKQWLLSSVDVMFIVYNGVIVIREYGIFHCQWQWYEYRYDVYYYYTGIRY